MESGNSICCHLIETSEIVRSYMFMYDILVGVLDGWIQVLRFIHSLALPQSKSVPFSLQFQSVKRRFTGMLLMITWPVDVLHFFIQNRSVAHLSTSQSILEDFDNFNYTIKNNDFGAFINFLFLSHISFCPFFLELSQNN